MAAQTTLKVTNRSAKKPIRNLPASIEIGPETTVEDVKKQVASAAGIGDHNRVGLFDPSTNKTLKNRFARLVNEPGVSAAGEVLVKDLGLQIAWRTVFVIEYLGPILFHLLIYGLRPYLYKNVTYEMSRSQWTAFAMIVLHFLKREYETIFVHRFSANTMPVRNIVKNSFFYWALAGLLSAYLVYHPTSLAARADQPLVDAAAVALYLIGEITNLVIHRYLATLRSPGGTERQIPHGYGFGIVTCPNYMFEIIAWVGIIIVSRSWAVVLFIAIGMSYMYDWGTGKERAYRREFGDKYKNKQYVMLPGLL